MTATSRELTPSDDRAWQRDIARFERNASGTRNICNQRACETDIVRIPHTAEDGYFRIVVCSGSKVLCPSPAFRCASTSISPSKVRGASLSTLPAELGLKIGSWATKSLANTYVTDLVSTFANPIQAAIQPLQLDGLTQVAATTVYDTSGVAAKVDRNIARANEQYDQNRIAAHVRAAKYVAPGSEVVENGEGPTKPYPIKFSGRLISISDRSSGQYADVPAFSLSKVADDVMLRLSGIYIAWSCAASSNTSDSRLLQSEAYAWQHAIVTVAPTQGSTVKVVERRTIDIAILSDFADATLLGLDVNIMVMAFLRPIDHHTAKDSISRIANDVALTQTCLEQPAWAAESVLERVKSAASQRSLTERVATVRDVGQRQLDKVPLHRIGIRTERAGLKDQLIGNGGICVRRR